MPQKVTLVALICIALAVEPPASVPVPASCPDPVELFPPPPPPPVLVFEIQTCMVYWPEPENCSTRTYTVVPPTLVPLDVTSSYPVVKLVSNWDPDELYSQRS